MTYRNLGATVLVAFTVFFTGELYAQKTLPVNMGKAYDHQVQADEDAYNKAGEEIGKGNTELEKSIDSYAEGNDDSGDRHYEKALDHYDNALDLID